MRYIAIGLLQVAGVGWVIRYATQPDSYYGDGTTHWQHASTDAGATYAVGGMVIASAIALVFIGMGLVPRWRRGGFAVLAGLVYPVSLYAAFFFLTVGH